MKDTELKIELFGRVQGVRFRQFVKETADELGVKGYVMNKNEGNVLVIAQGERKVVESFLERVSRGSPFSKVEGVSYFWRDKEKNYNNFMMMLDKTFVEDQKNSLLNLGKRILGLKDKIPKHVAIIPDGNRRWAKLNGLKKIEGHKAGGSYESISKIIGEAKNLGIKYLTFWAFSTENWKRDRIEVDQLFELFVNILGKIKEEAIEKKIKFRHIGRKDRLPEKLVKVILDVEKATKDFEEFNVQLCIDYGGRDEIVRALNKALRAGVQEIKEDDIVNYLDSAGIPDPDLIIRTSGEQRISGFMSFQSAYSEFYFTDVHFPDFGPEHLRKAVEEFSARGRRFGGN